MREVRIPVNDGSRITVRRGDAILVEDEGRIATALVDKIDQSDGHAFVTAVVFTGEQTFGERPLTHHGEGFRHVSAPIEISGKRFCLVSESDEAERALREHFQLVAGPAFHGQPDPVENPRVGSPTPFDPGQPAPTADPADLDHDGVVTKKERKQYQRDREQS